MSEGGEQGGRYQPSGDQLALASTVADALEDLLPISRLHAAAAETGETWSLLEGLGLFGIALAEEAGGSGLGAAEQALIVAALGRQLASPSVLATIGAAHAHWNGGGPAGLDGRRVAAAWETRGGAVVIEDPEADLVLLRGAEPKVHSVPADLEPVDATIWSVRLSSTEGMGNSIAGFDSGEALRLRLLDAAILSGLAEAGLRMAVAYAGMREQFGRPIGSFQAIKHRCADMAMAARGARDLVTFAAVAFDDGRADAGMLVESAFLMAGTAALDNAAANIQIHGGIGFSDEADPHLVLKRTQVCLAVAGGLEAAADRVAAASPGQA
jgi:alkylation response protein AidB-like acyl-CoA dehydrogenase